jgi:hypothetical protein
MGLHLPAARHQIAHRRTLARKTTPLPPIGPLADWHEPSSFRHAPR